MVTLDKTGSVQGSFSGGEDGEEVLLRFPTSE